MGAVLVAEAKSWGIMTNNLSRMDWFTCPLVGGCLRLIPFLYNILLVILYQLQGLPVLYKH